VQYQPCMPSSVYSQRGMRLSDTRQSQAQKTYPWTSLKPADGEQSAVPPACRSRRTLYTEAFQAFHATLWPAICSARMRGRVRPSAVSSCRMGTHAGSTCMTRHTGRGAPGRPGSPGRPAPGAPAHHPSGRPRALQAPPWCQARRTAAPEGSTRIIEM